MLDRDGFRPTWEEAGNLFVSILLEHHGPK